MARTARVSALRLTDVGYVAEGTCITFRSLTFPGKALSSRSDAWHHLWCLDMMRGRHIPSLCRPWRRSDGPLEGKYVIAEILSGRRFCYSHSRMMGKLMRHGQSRSRLHFRSSSEREEESFLCGSRAGLLTPIGEGIFSSQ